jgi:hypothetical protein
MARKKNEISFLAMHIKALNNRFAFIGYLKMLFYTISALYLLARVPQETRTYTSYCADS